MENNFKTYEEIANEVNDLGLKAWNLCKEARRFQNCRVMSLTASILSAITDMLLEAYDDLTTN